MSSHNDETGAPCTRHEPVSQDAILTYAAIGSRVSSFHHDVASKLQSLMMAIEEISESGFEEIRGASVSATIALQAINQLLTANRALTKTPQPKPTPLRELVGRAAMRHGVQVRGELIEADVLVALPSIAHALDLLLDMLAGPMRGERTVAVEVKMTEHVSLSLTATTAFEPNNEHIAFAAFLLAREAATLTCNANGFVVGLPL